MLSRGGLSLLLSSRIADAFELDTAELGRLFGVVELTASTWLVNDVPTDYQPKAAVVVAVAELLSRQIRSGNLSAIARRPAAVYGGRSMLEMIAADRHEELLAFTRSSFDYGRPS